MINQFPENQTDFTSFCTVPGKKPYSNAMKTTYNGDIKIFSDSIPTGIGMRDSINLLERRNPNLNVFQVLLLIDCYIIWILTYRIIMQNLT